MVALQIQDIKTFMNKLLLLQTFDNFLLIEGSITTYNIFRIDGRLHKDFFTEEELEQRLLSQREFSLWKEVKPFCLELIKGKKTPSAFRFVFLLSPKNMENTIAAVGSSYNPSDVTGMYINLKYQNQMLSLTPGIAYSIFSTDKTLESEWDKMVVKFLKQHEIAFDEI